ncbi:MAG: hypothetical protein RMJ98_07675 [Myxococcales bacterium]|nr:hypothetical protein [Polyangiaceae bacterium]MDW8249165.1 hypothetical protein [Myxococcales bacterium]
MSARASWEAQRGHWGVLLTLLALGGSSCVERGELPDKAFRLKVNAVLQDGSPLPPPEEPLCLDLRGIPRPPEEPPCPSKGRFFKVNIEALKADGQRDTSFNRFVRVSVIPGTVVSVTDGGGQGKAEGRNVLLQDGYASEQTVHVVGAFGPTRILVEDIGYQPGDPLNPAKPPACADGVDNDRDGLADFPADPGCAFANDDTEESGTFASGVSEAIYYALPTVAEAQGYTSGTPFAQEGIILETRKPRAHVVVTRITNNGFYITDVNVTDDGQGGLVATAKPFGSMFVFNFGLPQGVLVCDRITYLSGTMDEFFGSTQMNFPSFEVDPFFIQPKATTTNQVCLVPEPFEIVASEASNDAVLESVEGGLVRVRSARVAAHFGPDFPEVQPFDLSPNFPCQGANKYTFRPGASNCDFDRSGGLNFQPGAEEGICACFCYQDPDCSEWSTFRGRGNYRLVLGPTRKETIQANTRAVPGFSPVAHSGKTIRAITGNLTNFSGGNLNWTIEARCPDDLVLCPEGQDTCVDEPPAGLSSRLACIGQRTAFDNDSESGN